MDNAQEFCPRCNQRYPRRIFCPDCGIDITPYHMCDGSDLPALPHTCLNRDYDYSRQGWPWGRRNDCSIDFRS